LSIDNLIAEESFSTSNSGEHIPDLGHYHWKLVGLSVLQWLLPEGNLVLTCHVCLICSADIEEAEHCLIYFYTYRCCLAWESTHARSFLLKKNQRISMITDYSQMITCPIMTEGR